MARIPFTTEAEDALRHAREQAARRLQGEIEPRHLLLALVDPTTTPIRSFWKRLGIDVGSLWEAVDASLPRIQEGAAPESVLDGLDYTRRCREVLDKAFFEANVDDRGRVEAEDLLLALTIERGIARTLLSSASVDEPGVRATLAGVEADAAGDVGAVRPDVDDSESETKEERELPGWGPTPEDRSSDMPAWKATPEPIEAGPVESIPGTSRPGRGDGRDESDADGLSSLIDLNPADKRSLHRQIVEGVREVVASGGLPPGSRLPSIRDAAEALEVAPGTVARAYQTLDGEGVLEARGTRGTFVAAVEPDRSDGDPLPDEWHRELRKLVVQASLNGKGPDEIRRALDRAMEGVATSRKAAPEGS